MVTSTRRKTKERYNFTLKPEVVKRVKKTTIKSKEYNSMSDFVEKSIVNELKRNSKGGLSI